MFVFPRSRTSPVDQTRINISLLSLVSSNAVKLPRKVSIRRTDNAGNRFRCKQVSKMVYYIVQFVHWNVQQLNRCRPGNTPSSGWIFRNSITFSASKRDFSCCTRRNVFFSGWPGIFHIDENLCKTWYGQVSGHNPENVSKGTVS